MARTDNLSNFLTDVASAIRNKTGETGEIPASEFDNKIESIQAGSGDVSEYFNDTIIASNAGYYGWTTTIKKIIPNLNINSNGVSYLFAHYPNIPLPKLYFNKPIYYANYMFFYSKLSYIDFSQFIGLDTSNVTDMGYMFSTCQQLISLNLENLNTNNVTKMNGMFTNCTKLKNIDLSSLNTSNVTDMSYMFSGCASLTTINLGENFDTSNVTNMSFMFQNCSNLESIDLSNFDTSNVSNFAYFATSCKKIEEILLLKANKCQNVNTMLSSCIALENFGGLENLGMAYLTTSSANYNVYKLDLSTCTALTHTSLMNVINNLYDIATKGCNAQSLVLGATNLAKLSEEEIAIATSKGWNVT